MFKNGGGRTDNRDENNDKLINEEKLTKQDKGFL